MDAVVLLTCGLLVGLGIWTFMAPQATGGAHLDVRMRALGHVAYRWLRVLASSRLCIALLAHEPYRLEAEEVASRLEGAGVRMSLEECSALLMVGCGAIGVAAGLCARSAFVAFAALPLVAAAIPVRASQRTRASRRALAEQMPGVFRTLATALGSGQTLMQAVEYVGLNEGGAVAEPFARASLRLRCGVPAEAALKQLAAEMDAPGVDLMAAALAISQRTGSPLRELFQRSALLVEQQGEFHRMLQVKTAQVRLSVRIVCVLPVGLVVLLSLISPDFRQGLHTTTGIACLLVGATMDAAALLLIRRILKGVT